MNPELFHLIILFGFAISTMLALTFFLNTRLLKMLIREKDLTIEEYRYQDRTYLNALHNAVDERTEEGISYSMVKHIFGSIEAHRYQEDSLRLCKKFGLRPGYYRIDDTGDIHFLNRDDDFRNNGFAVKTELARKRPSMPHAKRFRILRRDGFRCQMCGANPEMDKDVLLHIDHKMPFAAGGTEDDDNLWTLCESCNLGKSDLVMPELLDKPTASAETE